MEEACFSYGGNRNRNRDFTMEKHSWEFIDDYNSQDLFLETQSQKAKILQNSKHLFCAPPHCTPNNTNYQRHLFLFKIGRIIKYT